MKKTLLTAIICATAAISRLFGQQHVQSMSFSGPTQWIPGTTVNLDASLTFSGYNAYGLSYWLEVPNALAPYLGITDIQWFTFPNHGQPIYPILFTGGGDPGYSTDTFDLGGDAFPNSIPSGTYHVTTITFSLAAGAPNGFYTMLTTSLKPLQSAVTDTDFNDNDINPPGMFVFQVVPEPSTLALLSFAAVGGGVLIFRRRNR